MCCVKENNIQLTLNIFITKEDGALYSLVMVADTMVLIKLLVKVIYF